MLFYFELIQKTKPDLLIANVPKLRAEKKKHLGIEDIYHLPAKRILLSHFSHKAQLLHHEIEKEVKKYPNVIVAYDGLEIEV